MSKNQFCVSKRVIGLTLIFFFFFVVVFYSVNRLLNVKTSIFSKAATPKSKNSQGSTGSSVDYLYTDNSFWKACGFTAADVKSYPQFKLNEPKNSFNNSYAAYQGLMSKWFVDIFYQDPTRLNVYEYGATDVISRALSVYNPKLNMSFYHKKCGLFEIALRRLISNYKNQVSPQKALNELIFLSGQAVYKDVLYPTADTFYPINNTTKGVTFAVPVCGFDPGYDISKYPSRPTPTNIPCQPIENLGNLFNVNYSNIYIYANESTTNKILSNLFKSQDDLKRSEMKIGIIYPKPIQFLIEKFIMKPTVGYALKGLQVKMDRFCMNQLSLDPSSKVFCGFNAYQVTDPVYVMKRITEARFGPNSIDPAFMKNIETVYSAYQVLAFIRGMLPSGEEVFLGDDFTTLSPSKQRELITEVVTLTTEMEVGHGGIYTFCQAGSVCIKTDLLSKPLVQYHLGAGQEAPGYAAFFTINADTISKENKFDLIYMISPFPIGSGADQKITEDTAMGLLSNLKPGGKLVIVYDPVFNQQNLQPSENRISTEQAFEILSSDFGCGDSISGNCSSGYVFGSGGIAEKNPDVYIFKFMDSEFFSKYFSDMFGYTDIKQIVKALIYTNPK